MRTEHTKKTAWGRGALLSTLAVAALGIGALIALGINATQIEGVSSASASQSQASPSQSLPDPSAEASLVPTTKGSFDPNEVEDPAFDEASRQMAEALQKSDPDGHKSGMVQDLLEDAGDLPSETAEPMESEDAQRSHKEWEDEVALAAKPMPASFKDVFLCEIPQQSLANGDEPTLCAVHIPESGPTEALFIGEGGSVLQLTNNGETSVYYFEDLSNEDLDVLDQLFTDEAMPDLADPTIEANGDGDYTLIAQNGTGITLTIKPEHQEQLTSLNLVAF